MGEKEKRGHQCHPTVCPTVAVPVWQVCIERAGAWPHNPQRCGLVSKWKTPRWGEAGGTICTFKDLGKPTCTGVSPAEASVSPPVLNIFPRVSPQQCFIFWCLEKLNANTWNTHRRTTALFYRMILKVSVQRQFSSLRFQKGRKKSEVYSKIITVFSYSSCLGTPWTAKKEGKYGGHWTADEAGHLPEHSWCNFCMFGSRSILFKEYSPKKEFRHLSCKLWTCVSSIPSDP